MLWRRSVEARPPDLFMDLMRRRILRHMHGATGSATLAMLSFFLLWPFARLDFDRHHDGYMLAQALAVHHGASVHADVFAQYGPVTPWLQSVALSLPMGPALALRVLNLALISVTVFLLADMGRSCPRDWPVSRAVGWWAAIAWIVLADVWLAVPMLPWSSTLTALLSVVTLYCLTRSLRYAEDGHTKAASITGLAGGAFLGVMPFTRINVGLSAVAVCFVVAVLILIRERSAKRALAGIFVLGAFLSSLTIILALFMTNSLADFYHQSITWPLTWGRAAAGAFLPQELLSKVFIPQALPVALVCGALFLQARVRTVQRGWSVTASAVNIFTVLAGLIIVIWENFRVFSFLSGASWKSIVSDLSSHLTSPNLYFIYFFLSLLVTVAITTCVIQVHQGIFREKSSRRLTPWLLLGGLSLSGLTQIIPVGDPRHVWWAAPIGLLLLFSVVRKTSKLNRPTGNPLILPLLGTLVAAVFSGAAYLGWERVQGPAGTVIGGMRVGQTELNEINQDTMFLSQRSLGVKPIVYLVDDGDLSILSGKFRSADTYFVEWGGAPSIQTRILNKNPVVVQKGYFSENRIRELARSIKYEVSATNQRLVVLMPVDNTSG